MSDEELGNVTVLMIAAIISVIVVIVYRAIKKNQKEQEVRFRAAQELRRKQEAEKYQAERKKMLQRCQAVVNDIGRLPILDKISSPLLHTPVYDSGMDEFYLPCALPAFDHSNVSIGATGIGWYRSLPQVENQVERALSFEFNAVAVVSDYVALLWKTSSSFPVQPGAKVLRFVRTGEAEWFACGWDAGSRRSAADVDPVFNIFYLENPEFWKKREQEVRSLCARNVLYHAKARECRHAEAKAKSTNETKEGYWIAVGPPAEVEKVQQEAPPDLREMLSEGAFIILGPRCAEMFAELAKREIKDFYIPREHAHELTLPTVDMDYCFLAFTHFLPFSMKGNVTKVKTQAWTRMLLQDISFGPNSSDTPVIEMISTREGEAVLFLKWKQVVSSALCVRVARELEEAYLRNVDRY